MLVSRYGELGIKSRKGTEAPLQRIFFVLSVLFAVVFAPFGGKVQAAVADHIITDTVDPDGITINLFDYWLTAQDEDGQTGSRDSDIGINQNHSLKFGATQGTGINAWGSGEIHQGIVSDLLGEDGYPVLAGDHGGESLAYLFDPDNQESAGYRSSYENVSGLLQVNTATGNYYYNSKENYAVYDASDHAFDVYDTWGVNHDSDNSDTTNGYFFPFTSADQVFTDDAAGNLQPTGITCNNEAMNHFFGMTMTAEFVQPAGGLVTLPDEGDAGDPMVFRFSGDDDIWVFIDGVLVMDIGGIHNAAGGTIDFSTGNIVIKNPGRNDITTTIRECFETAQESGFNQAQFSDNTFTDNSCHTLQVFYLERGAGASNLEIDFNIKAQPENAVYKMDQYGNGISGVAFELYDANSSYQITNDEPILTAVTGADGRAVFVNGERKPYDFSRGDASKEHYYVLKEQEESSPPGYRMSGEIHLRYTTGGQLIVSDKWESGAMSNFSVTVTEHGPVKDMAGNEITADELSQGTVFAVIFRKDNGQWYPLTGSNMGGWTMGSRNGMKDVIAAAQTNPLVFSEENGQLTVTVDEVPGDITEYYYTNLSDLKNARYVVGYYYTEGSLGEASETNTKRLNLSDFERSFSANIWVANIRNELAVKKIDETGASLEGAVFSLYRNADVSGGEVEAGKTPYDTVKTGEDGTALFPSAGKVLKKGVYYLKEEQAPEGYLPHSGLVKVIADDTGVYADAGAEGDGVRVHTGVGYLLKPMEKFGANDDIDATLHDIYAVAQTAGSESGDSLVWKGPPENAKELHLMYGKDGHLLQYGPYEKGEEPYLTTDTGFIRARVYQCLSPDHASAANKTDLNGADISGLFTGSVMVEVTNEKKTASVSVVKEVDGTGADGDTQSFEFTLTLTVNNAALSQTPVSYTGTGTVNGGSAGSDGQDSSVTTDKNGSITFTLKRGQQLQFSEIPEGAAFTVKETDYRAQGYAAAWTITYGTQTRQKTEGNTAAGTASYDSPAQVLFTNTRKFVDFSFTKTDGKSDSLTGPLSGAEFVLLRWTGEGAPDTAPADPDAPGPDWQTVTGSAVASGEDGIVCFENLIEEVTYRLVETHAPEGYITPAGQWNITYKTTQEGSGWEIVMAADGTKTPPAFIKQDSGFVLPNYGVPHIPSSGGRGLTLFAMAGTMLIGGAVLLLSVWAKRRKI